jgi:3D (Asp-Asp-Asp) domain-containing protein
MVRALLLFSLLFCVSAGANYRPVGKKLGRFETTYYYTPRETDYPAKSKTAKILDKSGKVIARVSPEFMESLKIEGSGVLKDGRVIGFAGIKDDVRHYYIIPDNVSRGTHGCVLEPFHILAVDPKVIPLGTIIRIPETIGMPLPNGKKHDGIWRAEDVGSAIKGKHVDLYVGGGANAKILRDYLKSNGSSLEKGLTLEKVSVPPVTSCIFKHDESSRAPATAPASDPE